jgi:hypothetical protein
MGCNFDEGKEKQDPLCERKNCPPIAILDPYQDVFDAVEAAASTNLR